MRWTITIAVMTGFVLAMALAFGGHMLNDTPVVPSAQSAK